MKVSPAESLMRTILSDLHTCRQYCAKSYLKNTFSNTPLLSLKASQNRLSWDGIFVCLCCSSCFHISVAGTYEKPSWHFLLPLNSRGLMHLCLGLTAHTHWSSEQVLSVHCEDYKSGWHKAACCNRDSERATGCPGPAAVSPAERQAENKITPL